MPVDVAVELNVCLNHVDPHFNLECPTSSSTIKSELVYRFSSKDERDNQALILLATGGFRGTGGVNFSGTISERLSGIVNNILGGDNDNFNLGVDLELGQDTPDVQTNSRVGLTLQTKINERILVNGKVGVPFGNNGTASQTVISGDVQVDFLLNEDGTLRAKVFNKENTIRNFGEEIGYQQGVGLSYNVEFDTFNELLQKIFRGKNKKEKPEDQNKETVEEEHLPDFITMKKKKSN